MQLYANSNRLSLKTLLFFIAVLIIAFFPVASFLFFIKNDAFVGYFPPKFFMSESIHAGYLPLWNPYINFGFPQYGDMSGGYWSPITWLMASSVGYNAYSFTIEVLLYLLIGGLGMYKLAGYFKLNKQSSIIAAVAFMCCGYNVGHLQHFNWLSGAAFLPWCLWAYLQLIKHFSTKNALVATLLFYLLISSAHPGIIISAFYFFIAVVIFQFFNNSEQQTIKIRFKKYAITHIILILLLLAISAGMVAGYLDIIPYFLRGEKIGLTNALLNPTNAQSWLSLLFPFATVKNDVFFNTDPTMRNCYVGLTIWIFFVTACFNKKNKWQQFLLVIGLLFALLSYGGIFKAFAYKFIPFIGYVRLNGEFRVFALLCIIIIAAIELNKFTSEQKGFNGNLKWVYWGMKIIIVVGVFFGLYNAIISKDSILYQLPSLMQENVFSAKLKTIINAISFYDTWWIQGFIQLLLLQGIKYSITHNNWSLLKKIVVVDMVLACLLNIPFTGVGKASVAQVQTILNNSPKGIPIPLLLPINQHDSITLDEKSMIGDWSMYSKQIGTKSEVSYPIILNNMRSYFDKDAITNKENHLDKPFVFGIDSNITSISIQSFSPQNIEINLHSQAPSTLIIQQNYYPHWYYENGVEIKRVNKFGINFMSVPVAKGNTHVNIQFKPTIVTIALFISATVFAIYCLALMYFSIRRKTV